MKHSWAMARSRDAVRCAACRKPLVRQRLIAKVCSSWPRPGSSALFRSCISRTISWGLRRSRKSLQRLKFWCQARRWMKYLWATSALGAVRRAARPKECWGVILSKALSLLGQTTWPFRSCIPECSNFVTCKLNRFSGILQIEANSACQQRNLF